MKALNALLLASILIISFSCKKDDDAGPTNYLTIDGKTVAFPKAFLSSKASASVDSGEGSVNYGYSLWITENGVTYNSDESEFAGTGKYFSLVLQSTTPNEDELPVGTYAVVNSDITIAELSELTKTGEDFIGDEPSKGSITISKSGSTYTIEIDLTISGPGVDNNFPVKGHYAGTLTIVD